MCYHMRIELDFRSVKTSSSSETQENSDMNKFIGSIIALALLIIAGNMTYTNIPKPAEQPKVELVEKVLPVLGRVHVTFDGMGSTVGFLAQDGDQFKILHYGPGSNYDNADFKPKFVTYVEMSKGKVAWNPVTVEQFN